MPSDATVSRVARPRGEVTISQQRRLEKAADRADQAQLIYRREVVAVLAEGASFIEVSKATGLSTATLQRWKREAQ